MSTRIAGCSLGKNTLGLVHASLSDAGELHVDVSRSVAHGGDPLPLFAAWYEELRLGECAALVATGTHAAELCEPILVLPEEACRQAALEQDTAAPPQLNLVHIGGRGYGALSRRAGPGSPGAPRYQYRVAESDKCSSGTGENILKLTARFGLDVPEADLRAGRAERALPITARCSVFAKSEMTHYANEGRSVDELLAGYFASIARNVRAMLARVEVPGPIYLVGGCARIATLRSAFAGLVEQPVVLPEYADCYEAFGAAALAADHVREVGRTSLPADPQHLTRGRKARFAALAPAQEHADKVTMMATPSAVAMANEPLVLGLDLGSTGAKAVLTSIATGEARLDLYDRTRGNPVAAAQRLVATLLARGVWDVRAVALTGSGRQAVASLCEAVFPDHQPMVLNEIVAHATAAIRCDPQRGADLSVMEIGGQDAKYIRISGGRIVESDLNTACSAGTGSFLEEQALLYDVAGIEEFIELAMQGTRPPDLGQMCTVFVAEAAGEARKDGFTLADVFAGFQYAVVRNYLHRVMGQRVPGQTVFFQGKPASNPSLAWTLAAVTGRAIVVPPNPGAMGAWGIGLCAIDEVGATALAEAPHLDLSRLLSASIEKRDEFRCGDSSCGTLCPISRTTVQVGDTTRVALSGGACPKYELATASRPKLDKDTPDPFAQRQRLRDRLVTSGGGGPRVALPDVGAVHTYLPWLSTLLRELGANVEVLRPAGKALAAGELLCNAADACGPVKVAFGVCDTDAPWLFFPKVMGVADSHGNGGDTCVSQQALPELVRASLAARGKIVTVLNPCLDFACGLDGPAQRAVARDLARSLGLPVAGADRAVARAAAVQRAYQLELLEIGRCAVEHGRKHAIPLVLLCGQIHVVHDAQLGAGLPGLLRQNGALALPLDCYDASADAPAMAKVYWGDDRTMLRAAAAARGAGDIFPLLITSFGCGPSSFSEQIFRHLLAGYPHSVLESDGHGGAAGFITRIQAFLQSVRQFRRAGDVGASDGRRAARHADPVPDSATSLRRESRYVFLSGPDHAGEALAAVYRSFGYDAVAAPALSRDVMELGRRDCSGKECRPYQLIWGAFRAYLDRHPPDKPTCLVQACGNLCRAGVMPIKDRMSLSTMGLSDQVSVVAMTTVRVPAMDAKVWCALVAVDILRALLVYNRAGRARTQLVQAAAQRYTAEVLALLEEPVTPRFAAALVLGRQWQRLEAVLRRASAELSHLGRQNPGETLRTVFVSGDLVTKGSDFASSGLFEQLAEHGVRVLLESTCDDLEFVARLHPRLVYGDAASRAEIAAYRAGMVGIRARLYRAAREHSPWLPVPAVAASIERSRQWLDPRTVGNSVLAIGSTLHHWRHHPVDGVVMAHCWGCDDGQIEESLLRRIDDMPTYFHYDDGTPADEGRIRAFVYRLQRLPMREIPLQEQPPRLSLRAVARHGLASLRR